MRLYIRENREPLFEPYAIGVTYKDKGEYLGISKGVHKFKRHNKPFFQKTTFGPRYHFEKVGNEINVSKVLKELKSML